MSKEANSTERALKLALEALENWVEYFPQNVDDIDKKVITSLREALASEAIEQPAQQEPVALKWQQAPIRTAWGDDMVVASVAIDKDHTVCLYCERDQTPKVDAMFAQRTWVHATEWRGLTDEEVHALWMTGEANIAEEHHSVVAYEIEAKLREKNT